MGAAKERHWFSNACLENTRTGILKWASGMSIGGSQDPGKQRMPWRGKVGRQRGPQGQRLRA